MQKDLRPSGICPRPSPGPSNAWARVASCCRPALWFAWQALRPSPGLTLRVCECSSLGSRAQRIVFAAVFTPGASPGNRQTSLVKQQCRFRLVLAHRLARDRKLTLGKQVASVKSAFGACALNPQPKGWGTSLVSIALGPNRPPLQAAAAPGATQRAEGKHGHQGSASTFVEA
jgi:hypothetical protein